MSILKAATYLLVVLEVVIAGGQTAPISSNDSSPNNPTTPGSSTSTTITTYIPLLIVKAKHEIDSVYQEIMALERYTVSYML